MQDEVNQEDSEHNDVVVGLANPGRQTVPEPWSSDQIV